MEWAVIVNSINHSSNEEKKRRACNACFDNELFWIFDEKMSQHVVTVIDFTHVVDSNQFWRIFFMQFVYPGQLPLISPKV